MNDDIATTLTTDSEYATAFVVVDLANCIDSAQIQDMTRTLARVLVRQALLAHGITPTNDNR